MISRAQVTEQWIQAWPAALEAWSKFTRLRAPIFCQTEKEAEREGLTGSFAMIRLQDQAIVVSIPEVMKCQVENFAREVLAHEIGHHVLAPATLTDHGRTLARMRFALPTLEQHAPMVANLYTDLLINDRLQRSAGLRMAQVYEKLGIDNKPSGKVWAFYTRIYEILWRLDKGALRGGPVDDPMEGDAWLGSRLIRSFAREWLNGAGRFATLILPYLMEDRDSASRLKKWFDTRDAGQGGNPSGLILEEGDERAGAVHPAHDAELTGDEETASKKTPGKLVGPGAHAQSNGQYREPFQYGELLRALGLTISDHDAAVRYYRERALPHLVHFPTRPAPEQLDPLPEGLEPWEIGNSLDEVDWLQTVMLSPRVIPGLTTVQRVWGHSPGRDPQTKPVDLDLYVDSSGSMPHPQQRVSYLTLAGAIIALSALRAGARVQVTLWSGTHEFTCTAGFTREETDILRVLTGFFGGGTAFPIHVLRDTYATRNPVTHPTHIMVISDDGVTTMFSEDEKRNSGWDVAARALARSGAGGTLVLNINEKWETFARSAPAYADLVRARREGWTIHSVQSWIELERFAREFSRKTYGPVQPRPSAPLRT